MSPEELGFVIGKRSIRPTVSAEGEGWAVDIYASEMIVVHPECGRFIKTGIRFKKSTHARHVPIDYQFALDALGKDAGSVAKNKGEIEVHVRNDSKRELFIINRGERIARIVIGG